jgi:radical SAM protein with 4Fe4S-binding SPASM domain
MEIQEFPLWEKIRNKRLPLSFELEITARCNLNCAHCYINLPAGDREAMDRELSTGQILSLARQAADMGALWCLITGGEPLLRPDFADIYLGLKRLGLLVSVFTNATLVSPEHASLFRKYPPRDIEITVYAVTDMTWEAVTRRPGSLAKFMRGLDIFMANKVPVRLKAMAVQSNLGEQKKIAEFCRSLTKDYFRFDPQLHLRLDRDPARNREIMAQRLTPKQIVDLEEADEKRIEAMREQCHSLINDKLAGYRCDHLFHCGAGNGSFSVSFDGRFRLCSSLNTPDTTFDLRTGSLKQAWDDFVPRVRSMRSRREEFIQTCRRCVLLDLCLWCPAHAYLETGALDGSTPYFCEVAHKRAESIKKFSDSEG